MYIVRAISDWAKAHRRRTSNPYLKVGAFSADYSVKIGTSWSNVGPPMGDGQIREIIDHRAFLCAAFPT
jgi:hypothetical protein